MNTLHTTTSHPKSNTQLLKETQEIADEIASKKAEVELLLNVIDELEIRYYKLVDEIKKNSSKK